MTKAVPILMIQTHARENTCLLQSPDSLKVNQWPSFKPIHAETNPDRFQWTFNTLLEIIFVVITSFQKAGKACGDLPFREIRLVV